MVKEAAIKHDKKILIVNALNESKQFYIKLGFKESGPVYLSGDKQVKVQKMIVELVK